MTVKQNAVVSIHYTVRDEDGVQLDSSEGRDPLVYLHGAHNIIPGLELALEGKKVGEQLQISIAPEEAYGEHLDHLVESVPLQAFGEQPVEVGMRFEAQTEQGPLSVVITAIDGEHVTVDGNHPLAGKPLSFDVTITDIRDASAEEVAHGHAHGPGGHHH
ncbi:MAG: peptidylprolyl isomerase [Porticoccaceae bacterium]|nr:peptidylprolyl isomerase [Porticoccaceae bacterium]